MNTAAQYDFEAKVGCDFSLSMLYEDVTLQAPIDLTGFTAKMQVRSLDLSTVVLDLNTKVTLGGAAGTIVVMLPGSDAAMQNVVAGRYRYDLQIVKGSNITPVLEGYCTIKPRAAQ